MSLSAQNILNSDPFGFSRFMNPPERKVIILWDYESCPVPNGVSGLVTVRNIREAALKFGSIDQFEAYSCWSNKPNTSIKNDLSLSGVQLRDCPHTGKKAAVSKTMVIDMMVYALERPRTTTVVLISSDRDYAYAISTLRNRGYSVKLLAPSGYLHPGLQSLADVLDWNSICKPHLPPSEPINFGRLAGPEGSEQESEDEDEEEETEEEDEDEEEDEEEEEDEAEEEENKPEVPATLGQHEAKVHVEVVKELEVVKNVEVEEVKEPEPLPEPVPELVVEVVREKEQQEAAEVKLQQFEFISSPPPSPTWSEPAPLPPPAVIPPKWTPAQAASPSVIVPAPLPAPAVVLPVWTPAPVVPPSVIVPLEPLSARLQAQPVQKPLPPPVPSPAPPTQKPLLHPVPSPTPPAQPQTAPPSYGGGSSPPGSGAHLLEKPARHIPPKFQALVKELEVKKAQGQPAASWSTLCVAVKRRAPSVIENAGVRRWKDYMLLAEEEGIVSNSNTRPGTETATLRI